MPDPATTTALVSFLIAGVAGSLHCIGMCGPILAGLTTALRPQPVALTIDPALVRSPRLRFPIAWDLLAYHVGRIAIYSVLGLFAGLVGNYFRHGSRALGAQQAGATILSGFVIVSGLFLLGILPLLTRKPARSCAGKHRPHAVPDHPWLGRLRQTRGAIPRILLGSAMGFLPCGLVYTMLILAAAQPNPAHAALGMTLFGLGTVPSLTAVLLAANLIPARFRAHGSRAAAILVIATGSWMLARSLTITAETCCNDAALQRESIVSGVGQAQKQP